MFITLTVFSILVITIMVWLANRFLPFTVCPICAGVFLTWVGLVGAHIAGYRIDLVVPAILMGGSVVGVAYQLEKKSPNISAGKLLLWKALFMPAGFVAAYSVLEQWWTVLIFAIVFLFLISLAFLSANGAVGPRAREASDLEKKMKECC